MADDNTLWVGGLADQVTEDHLYELFLQAGPLSKVVRPKEKNYAFVEFNHTESVPYAMQVMDGVTLFNQHLRLKARAGSQHDNSRSSSPSQFSQQPDASSWSHGQGNFIPEYQRSRSYHGMEDRRKGRHPTSPLVSHSGHGHPKHKVARSSSGGEEKRAAGSHVHNSPDPNASPLAQPFNSDSFKGSNMHPESFDDRRNRLIHKQNMSSSFQAQHLMGHNPYGNHGFHRGQNLNGPYNQQQQQHWRPQW